MKTAQDWIDALALVPHEEGGYYRQVAKAPEYYQRPNGERRALYTSIYFVLTAENPSHFHRLTADEIWYYHAGSPLTVHLIDEDGHYQAVVLGRAIMDGQRLQFVVPKGTIFGSTVASGFAVVSCMVAPGFEYQDFELFERQQLIALYPHHKDIIERLTRD